MPEVIADDIDDKAQDEDAASAGPQEAAANTAVAPVGRLRKVALAAMLKNSKQPTAKTAGQKPTANKPAANQDLPPQAGTRIKREAGAQKATPR